MREIPPTGLDTTATKLIDQARVAVAARCDACPVRKAHVTLSQLLLSPDDSAVTCARPSGRIAHRRRRTPLRRGKGTRRSRTKPTTVSASPSAPAANPGRPVRARPASKHDAVILAALKGKSVGMRLRDVARATQRSSGQLYAPLQSLIDRRLVSHEGNLYRLAAVAVGGAPASSSVVWSGRKTDPTLSGGVRPA